MHTCVTMLRTKESPQLTAELDTLRDLSLRLRVQLGRGQAHKVRLKHSRHTQEHCDGHGNNLFQHIHDQVDGGTSISADNGEPLDSGEVANCCVDNADQDERRGEDDGEEQLLLEGLQVTHLEVHESGEQMIDHK